MKNNFTIFLSLDSRNSPYFNSYFKPLIYGAVPKNNVLTLQLLIDKSGTEQKVTSLRFTSNLKGREKVEEFKVSQARDILKFLIYLFEKKKKFKYKEVTVIYRSFGGALILFILKFFGFRFVKQIYDSDGLAIDEKVEMNKIKKGSIKYHFLIGLEKYGVRNADSLVARSTKTIEVLQRYTIENQNVPFVILNNGRSHKLFQYYDKVRAREIRKELGFLSTDFILLYSGSGGVQYRFNDMFHLFLKTKEIIQNSKFLLVVNDLQWAKNQVQSISSLILENNVHIYTVDSNTVHKYLGIADVGLCLRTSLPSMQHVAPLKFREYLFSGVPTIVSDNTADKLDNFGKEIFVMPENVDSLNWGNFADWIKEVHGERQKFRKICRNQAKCKYDLKDDIEILKSLL